MTQNASIDITGRPTERAVLPLPSTTVDALKAYNEEGKRMNPPRPPVEIPGFVALLLREATRREVQWRDAQFVAMSNGTFTPAPGLDCDDPEASIVAAMMRKRAEYPYPDVVIVELARDMTDTSIAQVSAAFITGKVSDPLALGRAVARLKQDMTKSVLSAMDQVEPSPYSPPFMESSPGNATG